MFRKGISPLIAAVLLIAFTMAVASIFAQWAPQLIQDAQGDTKERAETIQDCSDRTIEVNLDDENDRDVNIQQTGGDDGIGNLTITWYWENNNPTQNTTDENNQISDSRGLTTIDSGYDSRTLTEVEVQPIDCEGAPTASWNP